MIHALVFTAGSAGRYNQTLFTKSQLRAGHAFTHLHSFYLIWFSSAPSPCGCETWRGAVVFLFGCTHVLPKRIRGFEISLKRRRRVFVAHQEVTLTLRLWRVCRRNGHSHATRFLPTACGFSKWRLCIVFDLRLTSARPRSFTYR